MPIALLDGRSVNVARTFGEERTCECGCGMRFRVTSITGRQKFASERCKERVQWRRESLRPEIVSAARARCRAWAAANRNCQTVNPWLYGPPPCGPYLPGGGMEIRLAPTPRWPIAHRNVRALHGLVTEAIGLPHDPKTPGFALIPWPRGCGWGVWIRDEDVARSLAARHVAGVLFDRPIDVQFSPLHRVRAPRISRRGRRHVRIDVITPTCIRASIDHQTVWRTAPTAGNICSTLATWMPSRVGVPIAQDSVRVEMVECKTQPETILLGGKFGAVRGFVGHLIVETNAVGHWLLEAATTVGLGGRTAFGFGRVRVSEIR